MLKIVFFVVLYSMNVNIVHPTKALIHANSTKLENIRKELTYRNTSIMFVLNKHKANYWWKRKNPVTWQERLDELQSQLSACLLFEEGGQQWIRPGSLPYLSKFVTEIKDLVPVPQGLPLKWKIEPEFIPYPYQSQSVERLIKIRHGNIEIPTGAGKSHILLMLAKEIGLDSVVVTPSKSIFNELLAEFQLRLGKEYVGGYGDGKKQIDKKITIAIGKSLTMLKEGSAEHNHFKNKKAILVDECFPYDTKILTSIGPVRIGTLVNNFNNNKICPDVLSFNEKNQVFEYKKITNAWKRPTKPLLNIRCGVLKFKCTENHKILTHNGWLEAKKLKINDLIVAKPNNKKANFCYKIPNNHLEDLIIGSFLGNGSIGYSKNNMPKLHINHGTNPREYVLWKLSLIDQIKGANWIIEDNGYGKKPAINIASKCFYYKHTFPQKKQTCPHFIIDKLNARSLSIWFMDDGSVSLNKDKNKIQNITLHTEGFDIQSIDLLIMKLKKLGIECKRSDDTKGSVIRINIEGIKNFIEIVAPYCHHSMAYKLNNHKNIGINEWKTGVMEYAYAKITAINKENFTSNKKYKQFLFDVEVEDNHNFLVGSSCTGIVAHNCHTFAADQLEKVSHGVLNDAIYRIFVSATQTRGDGTEKLLQSIIGETVFAMSLNEAIAKKYLCPLNFTIINTFSPSTRVIKDPLECKREHFLYNSEIAKIAAKIANAKARVKNESTLILVEEICQIQNLIKYLTVPYAYVHSSSNKEVALYGLEKVKLQEQVDRFNEGTVKVLIGTRAIATGTNIYPTHNTINWMGGGSEIITKQGAMGRSTRLLYKSKYAHLHNPKPFTIIYDFNVNGEPILNKQLQKRINYYTEANGSINYV